MMASDPFRDVSVGTGFFYVTTKNPRNVLHKLSLKKVRSLLFEYISCMIAYVFVPVSIPCCSMIPL